MDGVVVVVVVLAELASTLTVRERSTPTTDAINHEAHEERGIVMLEERVRSILSTTTAKGTSSPNGHCGSDRRQRVSAERVDHPRHNYFLVCRLAGDTFLPRDAAEHDPNPPTWHSRSQNCQRGLLGGLVPGPAELSRLGVSVISNNLRKFETSLSVVCHSTEWICPPEARLERHAITARM